MNYEILLKEASTDAFTLKKILNEILNIENKEKIDIIIESIKGILFNECFNGYFGTSAVSLDFINNYYERFGDINPFLDINLGEKIAKSSSNSNFYILKNVEGNIIESKWFFELIKPTNANSISIAKFQYVIEKINIETGISLQEKASRYYRKVRNAISSYVDRSIQNKLNTTESLDEQFQDKFIAFINSLMIDQTYYDYFEYNFEDLDEEENSKLHDLEKKLEKPLLIIKLYVDLVIGELFEATPTVVYKDMIEMLYFHKSLSEEDKFLSESPVFDNLSIIEIYLNIVYMATENSTAEIEAFVQKLKNINIKERFYDDMLMARRKSEELITKKLYSFPETDICKDLKVCQKWPRVKIFDLRDTNKKYNLLVRNLIAFDESKGKNHRFDCYTYINQSNNLGHFSSGKNGTSGNFLYGYFNIEPDHIVFQSRDDSYTTPQDSEIMANEQSILANGEFRLDEINIANNFYENGYIPKKPDYIIAYNEIDENIYNESLRLQIPILLLNPMSYGDEYNVHFTPYSAYYSETASIDTNYFNEQLNNNRIR